MLRFHPCIAPIKVAVFPLVKNKEEIVGMPILIDLFYSFIHRSISRSLLTLTEIVGKAQDIYKKLQMRYNVVYDTSGAIGRRYRRMDEAGTPMCICICTHTHARARAHTHTRTHTHTHTHTCIIINNKI